ncbi:MAG: sulfotransferase [Bacteroidota bacterium]
MTEQKKETWPSFLIIGAGKSGTTSLDYYLDQHPEVFMSPVKEPNFFGFELATEDDFKDDPLELAYYKQSVTSIEEYLSLFSESSDAKAIGEISNTYLTHENAYQRIKHHIPDTKLVVILRHPAERLYSRYLHLARDNRLPTENFSDCLDQSSVWWKRNDLIKEGFYYKNLSRFYHAFKESQIKVFLYEDLKNESEKLMKDLYSFVGVHPEFKPDTSVTYNRSGVIKSKLYNDIVGYQGVVRKVAGAVIPKRTFQKLKKNAAAQKLITKVRDRNLDRPPFDPSLKQAITEFYHEDITALSKLIGRNLDHWLAKSE